MRLYQKWQSPDSNLPHSERMHKVRMHSLANQSYLRQSFDAHVSNIPLEIDFSSSILIHSALQLISLSLPVRSLCRPSIQCSALFSVRSPPIHIFANNLFALIVSSLPTELFHFIGFSLPSALPCFRLYTVFSPSFVFSSRSASICNFAALLLRAAGKHELLVFVFPICPTQSLFREADKTQTLLSGPVPSRLDRRENEDGKKSQSSRAILGPQHQRGVAKRNENGI